MIQFKTKALAALLIPFCLATPVAASSAVPARQLTGVQEVTPQPIPIAQLDWKEFSSSTGKFAVLFPGKPTNKIEKDKDGDSYYTFTFGNDEGYYFLSYIDLPGDISAIPNESKKILLDTVVATFVQEKDGFKLLGKRSISLNNHPGEEFDFLYNNFVAGKGRLYLVGQRAYIMMVATPEQENTKKFLNSFRLLNARPLRSLP